MSLYTLVLPAMNFSILDAGILIMVQRLRLMMWTGQLDHSKMFFFFDFFCGTTLSWLKVISDGWWVGWMFGVGPQGFWV